MFTSSLALTASLLLAAEPTPAAIDALWDQVAQVGRENRKCPAKGGDELCAAMLAFLRGTLPGPTGEAQFGLVRPRYADDGKFVEADGAHLVYGGNPVHLFGLKPEDAKEAKKMADLAAAYARGKPAAGDTLTAGVIEAAKGVLAAPPPPALHHKRGERTQQIRPGDAPDLFAVRVFEKKLYLLSLTATRKKTADGRPPLSVASFALSP